MKNSDITSQDTKAEAIKEAKKQSLDGCVQHVNKTIQGIYYVSDWFNCDSTIASYVNGEQI